MSQDPASSCRDHGRDPLHDTRACGPAQGRSRAELIEDYEFLRSVGETHPEALARELGVSTSTVRQLKQEAAA